MSDSREPGEGRSLHHFLSWLTRGLRRPRNGEGTLRDSLEELIDEYEETEQEPVDTDQRRLLRNVLELDELTALDVMVPRADIVAVETGITLDELVKRMEEVAHSRLPVFRNSLDEVIGFVHLKDVVGYWNRKDRFEIGAILRQALFVAPSMRVLDLLLKMRLSRTHIALVVDEFGGIDGLVTIEDLVETIVGEIEDEHEKTVAPQIVRRPDGTIVADARAEVEAFEELVGPILSEDEREEIDTLGGLVFALAGRVPLRGEIIAHPNGMEFEVMEADPRRIRRLRVRNLPDPSASAGSED